MQNVDLYPTLCLIVAFVVSLQSKMHVSLCGMLSTFLMYTFILNSSSDLLTQYM